MAKENRSGYVTFKPRARLLKIIGEELISDEIVAITELVKNAHDADASTVSIEFHGVTADNGNIIVRDDGHGMDLDALLNQWMEPAGSLKSESRLRRTPRGRRVLGEKGVGRFAADKIARCLDLTSKRKSERREIKALFDWDQFDSRNRMLSEIRSRWELRAARSIRDQGTILQLSGLRSRWNEIMFRRISTRLCRLVSPFQRESDFVIRIESDEFPHYSGDLRAEFLDAAPYRVDAEFDGNETVTVSLQGSRKVRHLWNGPGALRCGPAHLRLFAFDLETESVAQIGPRMEVRAWLREWSGVSVYRDGFRIWPYGEPHDDWLRLDQRRVNNPVVRLSNNQVVGFVELSRDRNPALRDQTNREGLIHNRAFEDLRRLVNFVIQLLEAERQAVRHPAREGKQSKPPSDRRSSSIADRIERLARRATPALEKELRSVAASLREASATDRTDRQRELQGYSELASLGQAAAQLHDSVNPVLESILQDCTNVRSTVNGNGGRRVKAALRKMEKQIQNVGRRIAMIAPLDDGEGSRRHRVIDLNAELASSNDLFQPLLSRSKVNLRIDVPRCGVLRAGIRPEPFHRLLHILITNSIDWLDGQDTRTIRVRTRGLADRCEIIVSDSGPGIPAGLEEQVFQPLFSGREGARGMGLSIARDIVSAHGGTIEVLTDRRRRGANFRILLPRKRSRATLRH
jgi:signal transduction histidine kinase